MSSQEGESGCMDIRALPSSSLKALGHKLDPPDAVSCRLASHHLAAVTAQQQPSSHLHVVANSFQAQLHREQEDLVQNAAVRTAGTAAAAASVAAQAGPSNRNAGGDADAPAGPAEGGGPSSVTAAPTGLPALWGVTSTVHSVTGSPTSRTASGLARAALGYSTARVYVDVQQTYAGATWQQMFSALASCPIMSRIEVVEYCRYCSGSGLDGATKDALLRRTASAEGVVKIYPSVREQLLAQQAAAAQETQRVSSLSEAGAHHSPAAANAAAAGTSSTSADAMFSSSSSSSSPGSSSDWLPALVSCFSSQLKELQLQLPAALPVQHQPLLLQLKALESLEVTKPLAWPAGDGRYLAEEPVLLPDVVGEMSQLGHLRSLTCCVGPAANKELDARVVMMLQHTLSQLGQHLTQLTLGTSPRSRHVLLSAPLTHMPGLADLTCQPGFYLDAADVLEPEGPDSQAAAAAGPEGGSSAAAQPGGSSNGGSKQLAAAALVPSLTRLVLNEGSSHNELLALLTRRRLPAAAAIAAAASTSRLAHLEFNSHGDVPFELLGQLAGLRQLKAVVQGREDLEALTATGLGSQLLGLTVVCSEPGEMYDEWSSVYRPLQLLTALTSLTSLAIVSAATLLDTAQDVSLLNSLVRLHSFSFSGLVGSMTGSSAAVIGQLHQELLGLTLIHNDTELLAQPEFGPDAWPPGLTSLKLQGFICSGLDTQTGVSSSSSSSSRAFSLPNLLLADVCTWSAADAALLFRSSTALADLTLTLADDEYESPASHQASPFSQTWPQLTSLRLAVAGAFVEGPQPHGTALGLSGCKLEQARSGHAIAGMLPGLAAMKGLQHLHLTCPTPVSSGTLCGLSCLSRLSRLRSLALDLPGLLKLEALWDLAMDPSWWKQVHSFSISSTTAAAAGTGSAVLATEAAAAPTAAAGSPSQPDSMAPRTTAGVRQGREHGSERAAVPDDRVLRMLAASLSCCSSLRRLSLSPELLPDDAQRKLLEGKLLNCLVISCFE